MTGNISSEALLFGIRATIGLMVGFVIAAAITTQGEGK